MNNVILLFSTRKKMYAAARRKALCMLSPADKERVASVERTPFLSDIFRTLREESRKTKKFIPPAKLPYAHRIALLTTYEFACNLARFLGEYFKTKMDVLVANGGGKKHPLLPASFSDEKRKKKKIGKRRSDS